MKRLFLDTGILVAAISRRDEFHQASRRLLERVGEHEWATVQTSDFVLAEAFNFIARKIRRREAAEHLVTLVFGSDETPGIVSSVVRIHAGRFAAAVDRFRTKFAKGLSLTDWTTVVAMEELGIHELATFDRGFRGLVTVTAAT